MIFQLKKIIFILTTNFSLFFILMVGIQNSSNKEKVKFIKSETINLPISFIVGLSFISGSLTGSFLNINSCFNKD